MDIIGSYYEANAFALSGYKLSNNEDVIVTEEYCSGQYNLTTTLINTGR